MIKRLKLVNWTSHKESEFVFGKGTNVLVGVIGSGKSLPYSEEVLINAGEWKKEKIGEVVDLAIKKSKKIEVRKGETIIAKDNVNNISVQSLNLKTLKMEKRKISSFIKHRSPKKIFRIHTRQGKSIAITKDHSILVLNEKGEIVPCRGSNLKINQFIPCPKKMELESKQQEIDVGEILPEFRDTTKILYGLNLIRAGLTAKESASITGTALYTLTNWRDRKTSHKPDLIMAKHLNHTIQKIIPVSEELMAIVGAYIAEGGTDYKPERGRYKIQITNIDDKYIERLIDCWKKVFPNIPIKRSKKGVQINSKVACCLFLRLFRSGAENKFLPDFMYNLTKKQMSEFLKMYFEGDGWVVPKNRELGCASKSIKLMDGIQTVLMGWGIISRIRKLRRKEGKYYELVILPKYIPRLAEYFSFLSERKQQKLESLVKIIKESKRWDGVDVIPNQRTLLGKLSIEYRMGKRDNPKMRRLSNTLRTYKLYENLGREKLIRSLKEIYDCYGFKTKSFEELEKIYFSDVFFDKIAKIEEIPPESDWVYDLSVEENENFVAGTGNLIVHNSSVMNALSYALFGSFPSLNAKSVKLDEIIMNKPSEMDSSRVELEFGYGGENYLVERVLYRGKKVNEAKLFREGKIIAGPKPSEVTAKIEELLEMNYDLFSRAVYSEQNQIDYFLRLSPQQRKEKFDELLQINRYEKARANAVMVGNRMKKNIKDREGILNQLKGKAEETREKELKEKIEKKETEGKELKEKTLGEKKELKEKEKKLNELEAREKEFRLMSELMLKSSAKIEELGKEIGRIEKEEKVRLNTLNQREEEKKKKQLNETKKAIEEKMEEVKELERRILSLKEKIDFVEMEAKEKRKGIPEKIKSFDEAKREEERAEKEKKKIGVLLRKKEKELNELTQFISLSEEKILGIEKQLNGLHKAKAHCPLCETKLGEGKRKELLEGKKKERERLEREIKAKSGEKEKKEKENEKTRLALEEMETELDEAEKYRGLFKEIEKADKTINELRKEEKEKGKLLKDKKEKVNKEMLEELEKEIESVETVLEGLKKVRECSNLKEEEEKLEKELNKLGFKEEELVKLRKEIVFLESGINSNVKELITNEERIMEWKKQLKDAVELKEKLAEIEKGVIHQKEMVDKLNLFTNALIAAQAELREELIDTINQAMDDVWNRIYPYEDFTSARMEIEEGNYELKVRERNGRWVRVEGILSGGERSAAAICIRIAFSLVLAQNLSWLILDEPTHNLDRTAVRELTQTMKTHLPELVEQIFVITHDPEMEKAASASYYVLDRNKNEEGITIPKTNEIN